jgi:hypothetical protein
VRWLAEASPGGFEGVADVDPYEDTVAGVATSRSRMPYGAGVVVTAPGVVLRARVCPYWANSGGDGVLPA